MSKSVSPPVAAIVTSRVRRLVEPDEPWLLAMRAALRDIAETGAELVLAEETAAASFLRRTATRLKISVREMFTSEAALISAGPSDLDRTVVQAADLVYVLHCRSNGNIHRVLRERIDQGRGGIVVVDLDGLQSEAVRGELQRAGARFWQPGPDLCGPLPSGLANVGSTPLRHIESQEVYSVAPRPLAADWTFLTHTTRACPGPWPDESMEDYIDSLLESRFDANHSALGTLCRIVRQKRLIGSEKTIRGGHRVVSFTACPLEHLPRLHRYRRHRVRWDFEPYGLCFNREWLIRRGARPVSYGDEDLWSSLPEQEQPFFQIATGDSGIDWSEEQEWRIPGDLDLTTVGPEEVFLFVPDSRAAKIISTHTNWGVTLWPGIDD